MQTSVALSVVAFLALTGLVLGAPGQRKGYCGTGNWHKWSSCERLQNEAEINSEPILCYDDIPGYTQASRHCVESLLCADPMCNKATGNSLKCYKNIAQECESLGLKG